MELGAFSINLAVKDIERSKIFYEKFEKSVEEMYIDRLKNVKENAKQLSLFQIK